MGTDKRQRKKVNRAARLQQEQRDARRRGAIRRMVFLVVLVVGVLGLALLFNLLTGDEEAAVPAADAPTTSAPTETPGPAAVEPECPAEDDSSPRTLAFSTAPPMCIDPEQDYSAVVQTNLGDFTIDLDAQAAPQTVNNFVFLARHHYYDDVDFHRIIPGFVVQGGDATGTPPGTGGPGYEFEDELPQAGAYEIGSVAMANNGPNTNGSQFFVITGERGVALPPQYSLFGQVTEGFDVVEALEATVDADTGEVTGPAVIEDITIAEA